MAEQGPGCCVCAELRRFADLKAKGRIKKITNSDKCSPALSMVWGLFPCVETYILFSFTDSQCPICRCGIHSHLSSQAAPGWGHHYLFAVQ